MPIRRIGIAGFLHMSEIEIFSDIINLTYEEGAPFCFPLIFECGQPVLDRTLLLLHSKELTRGYRHLSAAGHTGL